MRDSVFTKIIKGELPCHKVYEDDKVIAFLDIDPLSPGHTLVVPKQQVDSLWDIDDDLYYYLMKIVKLVAQRQRALLRPPRIGMMLEGFAVPHVHIHVYPLEKGIESTITDHIKRKQSGEEPDHAQLAEMAQKLAF